MGAGRWQVLATVHTGVSPTTYTQESAFDAGVFFFCFEAEILENLAGPCGAPTYLPTYLPYLRETKKEIICWVKVGDESDATEEEAAGAGERRE